MIAKKITVAFILSILPYCAFSGVFTGNITINPGTSNANTETFDLDTAKGYFDQVSTKNFKKLFSDYSQRSEIFAQTVYQGVTFNIDIPSNSNTLTLSIPAIGVNKTFQGSSRTDSAKKMENYLRDNGGRVGDKIREWSIAHTPNSPIAGNYTALANQLFGSTFKVAENAIVAKPNSNTQSASAPFMVGVNGGNYTQTASNGKSTDISVFSAPISYALNIFDDPRKKMLINGQFNYVTVGQAETFQGNLGLGYLHPMEDNWQLIPSLSYGAIGSQDLATLGQIFSAAITSNYQFKMADYPTSVVNMLGYYKTLPLSIDGLVNTDPNISNVVLKNGIFPTMILPFKAFGHQLKMKGIFTDTELFGSSVFLRQYNEIGFELISVDKVAWLDKISFGMADSLSISAKYIFSLEQSNRLSGYDIGISYDF